MLIPKLLFAHHDETTMLIAAGVSPDQVSMVRMWIGFAEIAIGLSLLMVWSARSLFALTIVLMVVALASVAIQAPEYLSAAFNPVTLNTAVIGLSVIGLLAGRDLPSAKRCKRKRPDTT